MFQIAGAGRIKCRCMRNEGDSWGQGLHSYLARRHVLHQKEEVSMKLFSDDESNSGPHELKQRDKAEEI